jgi:hypothetical protein
MMPAKCPALSVLLLLTIVAPPSRAQQPPAADAAGKTAPSRKVAADLATALAQGDSKSLMTAVGSVHEAGADGRAQLQAMALRIAPLAKAAPAAAPADAKAMAEPLGDDDRALVEALVGGEPAAAEAAAAKLQAGAATNAATAQRLGRRAEALLTGYVVRVFREQEETRAQFAGQYNALRDLGPLGLQLLSGWLEKPPAQMRADLVKTYSIRALRDVVGGKPDAALMGVLTKVAKSPVESQGVSREAVFALAQFGDRSLVDPQIKSLEERAASEDPAKSAVALGELADVHYQLRDFASAAAMHKRHVAILEANETVAAATRNLPTLYYNACCSMALAGQIDDAFAHLDKAIAVGVRTGQPLTKRLLEVDMDIAALRQDPRFAEVMQKFGARK